MPNEKYTNIIREIENIKDLVPKMKYKSERFCVGVGTRKINYFHIIFTHPEANKIFEIEDYGINKLKAYMELLPIKGFVIKKLNLSFDVDKNQLQYED